MVKIKNLKQKEGTKVPSGEITVNSAQLSFDLPELKKTVRKKENSNDSIYQIMIELLDSKVYPYQGADELVFVDFVHGGIQKTAPIRSLDFRKFMIAEIYAAEERVPGEEALKRVRDYFTAKAYSEGNTHEVFTRVTERFGSIFYDLCNDKGEVVEINQNGWRIVTNPSVRFVRKRGMAANVTPDPRGDISMLKKHINFPDENGWILMATFVLASFTNAPTPLLLLKGEQGSSKSTTSRVLKTLIDPSFSPLVPCPKNERDLFIAASNGHLLVFDNLSGISQAVSDQLCRLCTGGGFRTRLLYTDDEELILDLRKPIIANGIDEIAYRGDLRSRSLFIDLPEIRPEKRMTENEIWSEFNKEYALILGGIFNALVIALQNLQSCRIKENVRMADFMLLGHAASQSLGISEEKFNQAYLENIKESNLENLDSDPLYNAIVMMFHYLPDDTNEWRGTITDFMSRVGRFMPQGTVGLKSPQSLLNEINRLKPALKAVGIKHEKLQREGGTGKRLHRIYRETISVQPGSNDNSDECDDIIDISEDDL
jgi:hypothetical protein